MVLTALELNISEIFIYKNLQKIAKGKEFCSLCFILTDHRLKLSLSTSKFTLKLLTLKLRPTGDPQEAVRNKLIHPDPPPPPARVCGRDKYSIITYEIT